MKSVLFYKKFGANLRCTACRHYCIIPKGSFGLCGARKNEKDKIVLVTNKKPCSLHLDPIEKKPLYHYLPNSTTLSIGFFGCNFRCDFCQNADISFTKGSAAETKSAQFKEVSPKKFVELAQKEKANSIAFTYNEPSISVEYNLEAILEAKKHSPALGTVYVSNGYTSIEQISALSKGKSRLDAINIDLKGFQESFYQKTCGSKLENVLNCIRDFHKAGVWLELTTLIIPGQNDSNEELHQIAKWIADLDKNIPWHVSAFFPMHKMTHLPPTSAQKILDTVEIGKNAGLNFVYGGNINANNISSTFCPKCNSLLIKRSGHDVGIVGLNFGKCINCGEKINGVFE
ncbi:MAG: AmmeMemoRadiSam system radical SAM enzyme [archaeon]